jgi:hypothetical protein
LLKFPVENNVHRQTDFTDEKYAINYSKNSISLLSYYLLASVG